MPNLPKNMMIRGWVRVMGGRGGGGTHVVPGRLAVERVLGSQHARGHQNADQDRIREVRVVDYLVAYDADPETKGTLANTELLLSMNMWNAIVTRRAQGPSVRSDHVT